MKYQIIIPSKDELDNLKIIIPNIVSRYDLNIMVIDKSKNFNEVKKYCESFKNIDIHLQTSQGKGNALREAVNLSKAEILIFFDADCSHDPSDIQKFIDIFENNEQIQHIGGSRMRGGSDELFDDVQHFIRLFGSLVINLTINLKFNSRLTDSQNGFRAITKEAFLRCNTKSAHTSIETELVAKSLSEGIVYTETLTHEWSRKFGVSKINLFYHSWAYIYALIKIIFYKKPKKSSFIKTEISWFNND
jgi:glycosyltransferase involved in cell wall biosynthesis